VQYWEIYEEVWGECPPDFVKKEMEKEEKMMASSFSQKKASQIIKEAKKILKKEL
jgi:hypothetical protein